MARMDHNPESRHSFGIEEDAWDALDHIVDAEDEKSKSHLIRSLIYEKIEEHTDDDTDTDANLPDEPRLREAYLTLLDIAEEVVDGGGLRCTLDEAKNNLYTNNTPKEAVKSSLLTPLRAGDYVRIDPGMSQVWVVVRPRQRPENSVEPGVEADRAVATDGGER